MACSISAVLFDGAGHWEWPQGVALIPLQFSAFAAAAKKRRKYLVKQTQFHFGVWFNHTTTEHHFCPKIQFSILSKTANLLDAAVSQ